MQLHIIARGKIGRSPEADLVARYVERINWPIKLSELPDRGGKMPKMPDGARTVMLDELGTQMTSQQLADTLANWRDNGVRETRFLIGAADGFDEAERAGADILLGFGRATWPHLLARAMLAEQIYRATTIIAGHPYHREG